MIKSSSQSKDCSHGSDPRSGIVLVTVLWTIALVAALAMAASMTFRGYAGIVAIDRDRARTETLMNAGLEAAAGIVAKLGDKGTLTERETLITLSTGAVRIELSDDGGRINVNKAPVDVLLSLLRMAGAGDDAPEIAKAIDAWRVAGQAAQPGSAPQANNPATAMAAAPTSAPPAAIAPPPTNQFQSFTDLRQLLQIPGMTPDLLAAILPLTTVFGDDKINAFSAPADVIMALPGVSPSQASNFLAARRGQPASKDALIQLLGPGKDAVKAVGRPIASVVLTTRLLDGYGASAKAVIAVVPKDPQPYRVLAWTPLASPAHRASLAAYRLEEDR